MHTWSGGLCRLSESVVQLVVASVLIQNLVNLISAKRRDTSPIALTRTDFDTSGALFHNVDTDERILMHTLKWSRAQTISTSIRRVAG